MEQVLHLVTRGVGMPAGRAGDVPFELWWRETAGWPARSCRGHGAGLPRTTHDVDVSRHHGTVRSFPLPGESLSVGLRVDSLFVVVYALHAVGVSEKRQDCGREP